MELFEAIARRHSYRGSFLDKSIPRGDLAKIVQAGIQAPSGMNKQTTEFVIVDAPEVKEKLADMAAERVTMAEAQAYIACVINTEPEPILDDHSFEVEDCAAAVENMLLAITELGYATVWIDGWLRRENRARRISDLLGLPASKIVRVILPLGVPAETKEQAPKMSFEERACFNFYSGSA